VIVLAGPVVWAAHFFVLYGAEALVCTQAASPSRALQWVNIGATAVALAALAALLIRQYRSRQKNDDADAFLRSASLWLALISAGAICGTMLSAWRVAACLPPAG
jgi:uncharacterized membrane protein YgdD (TMEM256/DUF423 family)